MIDRIRPCATATSSSPAPTPGFLVIMIAPPPTRTRAKVPTNSATKCRRESRKVVLLDEGASAAKLDATSPTSKGAPSAGAAQHQRGVDPAEAEGVRQHVLDPRVPPLAP